MKARTRILSVLILLVVSGLLMEVAAQQILKLDNAITIASQNSPDIKRVRLNMERSQELLKAQNAALKSNFQC